jgi:hypothetical protein
LPSYYTYHERPVKIVETDDGGMRAWALDWDTGGWAKANQLIDPILFAIGGDVFKVPPDDFVDAVEFQRSRRLSGDAPVFALYDTIRSIADAADRENRRLTLEEKALIKGLRRKTYRMFEEELRRQGDPAADPDLLET